MKQALGLLLVLIGLAFVILALLGWLGIFTPNQAMALSSGSWPEVAIAVLETVPWVALVGLLLIYAGLRTLGVDVSLV